MLMLATSTRLSAISVNKNLTSLELRSCLTMWAFCLVGVSSFALCRFWFIDCAMAQYYQDRRDFETQSSFKGEQLSYWSLELLEEIVSFIRTLSRHFFADCLQIQEFGPTNMNLTLERIANCTHGGRKTIRSSLSCSTCAVQRSTSARSAKFWSARLICVSGLAVWTYGVCNVQTWMRHGLRTSRVSRQSTWTLAARRSWFPRFQEKVLQEFSVPRIFSLSLLILLSFDRARQMDLQRFKNAGLWHHHAVWIQ